MELQIRFTALLLFIFSCISTNAQQVLNLDFEKASVEGKARPWGWSIDTYINTTVQLDTAIRHHGKYSLQLNADQAPASQEPMILDFAIECFELKNKTIKVEGWIKTNNLDGSAYFTVACSSNGDSSVTEKKSIEVNATTEWKLLSLILPLPETVQQCYITIQHVGKGAAWFDDFSFSINGKKVEQVEVSSPFTRSQMNWLETVSYPLSSVDASKAGDTLSYDDLAPFGEMVRDAQIIALGEATHGTSEFFRMKHRILQYCVMELGVRIFAIEDNQLVVKRVNRYIAGGDGDARSSMYGMFGVWQTQEVRDMIEWLRRYNDSHPGDKVQFVGFDVQNFLLPIDSLYAFLNRVDVIIYKDASALLDGLKQQGASSYAVSDSVKLKWFQNAERVLGMLSNHKGEWLAHAQNQQDSMNIYWGIQYATLVKQYAENTYKGHLSLYRDEAMAENISWILAMNQPASRMLIWAHNNHISRGDHPDDAVNIYNGISMGSWLSKKYGDKYKAFELSTYKGAYWAQVSYSNFKMMSCPLYDAPRGSIDEALHRISEKKNTDLLLLDLKNGRNEQWLTQPVPERFANHVNIEYGYWTKFSVPFQYDGVFFIDVTSPARSYVK